MARRFPGSRPAVAGFGEMDMRLTLIAMTSMATLLAGCSAIRAFREDSPTPKGVSVAVKDCIKGDLTGCPPINRKQYYDDRTARYYYFDPGTGRYYWENGDPRF
jgi:hypothetical protein